MPPTYRPMEMNGMRNLSNGAQPGACTRSSSGAAPELSGEASIVSAA